jgi:DNA-binding HxlR family transcriptional regulator
MVATTAWQAECPVVKTLERVGDRWSILLLRELFRGAHRFDELQTSLGIAPNILSSRLTRLIDAGFVEKQLYQEHPPRYSYVLAQRGQDFMPVLFAIVEFGNKHFSPDGPAVVVVDSSTMEIAEPVVVDGNTGVPITSSRFTIASTGRANRQTQAKYPLQVCKPKPKATAGAKVAKKRSTSKSTPAKSTQ